ncbi:hypothetical protein [Streptomyces sp. NPDC088400]|uniref:hypothetical protein n=1 Tax=Streptomyces sp. NPDC088400 TaxID=3365861 RepID=UPI00380D9A56
MQVSSAWATNFVETGQGPSELARALGLAESGDPRRLQRQHARRWMEGEWTPGHWWPYIARVLGLDPERTKAALPGAVRIGQAEVAAVRHMARAGSAHRRLTLWSSSVME